MEKVYLVHGWADNSKSGWFPWLKRELEKRNDEVIIFDMPNSDEPSIEKWVNLLIKNIHNLNENIYFVGHSIGCQTILRFLERLSGDAKIGGCIFVAGWFDLKEKSYEADKEIAKPWIETPINFGRVKKHCKKFISIFSEDDPFVNISQSDLFKKKLNSKIVLTSGRGHFTAKREPAVLEEFLRFFNN